MRPIFIQAAAIAAALSTACQASPEVAREGFVTTDDGVPLYFVERGSGADVLVVPVGFYLEERLEPLAEGRRVIFYDPRHRGRSGRGDLSAVSLDRQIADLETLRAHLGVERMAVLGWSGLGMEMAVYAMRHPDRVTRLVQLSPVPPAASIMRAEGDSRGERADQTALEALDARADAGAFADDPEAYCRARNALTNPTNFADPARAREVPDVCVYENEWPINLWPYFGALLGGFGDYDWRKDLAALEIPRLVVHGREDGVPLAGARAWAAGYPNARLLVLSPAGHFPFIEQPEATLAAIDAFLDGGWPVGAEEVPAPEG